MLVNDTRRHLFRALDAETIPLEAAARLAALGITTLAELRDHWNYGNRQLMINFLEESPLRFVSAAPSAMLATRGTGAGPSNVVNLLEAGPKKPLVRRPRGVILTPAQMKAPATPPAGLAAATRAGRGRRGSRPQAGGPPQKSLIGQFPAIRNQESRGTCVAFASVAFLEFHRSAEAGSAVKRHSEQFVYWGCKQDDGEPGMEGTFVSTARTVLAGRGACLNSTWKYKNLPVAHNEGQGPPPKVARQEARTARWAKSKEVAATNPSSICKRLDEGLPVVLSVKTFPSWDFDSVNQTGEILMPVPGTSSDGGHALCVVGYELNSDVPGGGAFIIRNSWGTGWAKPSGRFGAGYGTLFFEYVKKYGLEAFA